LKIQFQEYTPTQAEAVNNDNYRRLNYRAVENDYLDAGVRKRDGSNRTRFSPFNSGKSTKEHFEPAQSYASQ
jgi:hypothetical protein